MYLPDQMIPDQGIKYLVVHKVRATGATVVDLITDDKTHAANMARIAEAYVIQIHMSHDYRPHRDSE